MSARLSGWKKLAPFFLIGPVSGPLLAGVIFSLRAGRPFLAGAYAVALVAFVILLPTLVAKLGVGLI